MVRTGLRRSAAPLVLLLAASASGLAADLDGGFLRGDVAEPYAGSAWDGLYAGLSLSYVDSAAEVAGGARGAVRNRLTGTVYEEVVNASTYFDGMNVSGDSLGYGGYIGHNWSWDGVVFGLEGSYQRVDFDFVQNQTIAPRARSIADFDFDGTTDIASISGTNRGTLSITDMAAIKTRIGYDAGAFMPFLTLGVAAIRGDSSRTTVVVTQAVGSAGGTDGPTTHTLRSRSESIFGFGFTGGIGVDYMLSPGIILRGEYEATRIGDFDRSLVDLYSFKSSIATKF
jgi:outer membrane immunogenic protein